MDQATNIQINEEGKCNQCTPKSTQKIAAEPVTKPLSWLKCEKCNFWIHPICDDLSEEDIKIILVFYCKNCRDKGHVITRQEDKASKCEENITQVNDSRVNDTSNSNDIDADIIPNSQPEILMPESTLLTSKINEKSKENIFNVKANKENIKQTNENDEESAKSKALESRKKATILSEYRKLERKIKER